MGGGIYGSLGRSPRQLQLRDAATRTLATGTCPSAPRLHHHLPTAQESNLPQHEYDEEPFIALRKVFSTYPSTVDLRELYPLKSYLERLTLGPGHVLWRQGDASDGLYIVESGVLRATYAFAEHTQNMEETMFAGTLAGELSALSDLPRNATVLVERPAVLWKLSSENLTRLRMQEPELATAFTLLVLKCKSLVVRILCIPIDDSRRCQNRLRHAARSACFKTVATTNEH